MINTSSYGVNSFRNSTRKVSAFPEYHEKPVNVWRPKLNETVQIPNGLGTVVRISKDMYLIDLDNQFANVWERLTSINAPHRFDNCDGAGSPFNYKRALHACGNS